MRCESLFHYCMVKRLLVANGYTHYMVKFNLDVLVERLKACLVAKGYTHMALITMRHFL
jgi:hypothetical protein